MESELAKIETRYSNRAKVRAFYQVGADGRIRRPGMFQGEMVYIPYFWDLLLEGVVDRYRHDGEVGFKVYTSDRTLFPELQGVRTVWIRIDPEAEDYTFKGEAPKRP